MHNLFKLPKQPPACFSFFNFEQSNQLIKCVLPASDGHIDAHTSVWKALVLEIWKKKKKENTSQHLDLAKL